MIQATSNTIDLANEVGIEAFKVGADPAVLLETDELFYGQFKYLTAEQLRSTSKDMFASLGIGLNKKVAPRLSPVLVRPRHGDRRHRRQHVSGRGNRELVRFEGFQASSTVLGGKPIIEGGRLLL